MLDQVNEEIESSSQVTREIQSDIIKCSEFETTLAARETELTKMVYMLGFELVTVAALLLELDNGKIENERLLRDIDELKTTLLSAIPVS